MAEEGSTSTVELAVTGADLPVSGTDEQKPIPGATDENAAVETPEQQATKEKSRFARRLDRQKTARIEAETEARLLREQLAKLQTKESAQQESGEPKRGDYPDYETYLRAATKWDAKQEVETGRKADREAQQGKEKQSQAASYEEKIGKAWIERENTFKAANKDYEETVKEFVDSPDFRALSPGARRAIVESDVGPAALHYLATHEDDVERISELSPERQIAELGKIETKVAMPGKRTTEAPAPAKTLTGSRTSTGKDIAKMSQAEYETWRKSSGARWG